MSCSCRPTATIRRDNAGSSRGLPPIKAMKPSRGGLGPPVDGYHEHGHETTFLPAQARGFSGLRKCPRLATILFTAGAKMSEIRIHIGVPVLLIICSACLGLRSASTLALASPNDACRKEICDSAVAACMRTDQSLNPLAATQTEKKSFCDTYFNGCMRQYVPADVPWYSPETVARFLQCPPIEPSRPTGTTWHRIAGPGQGLVDLARSMLIKQPLQASLLFRYPQLTGQRKKGRSCKRP